MNAFQQTCPSCGAGLELPAEAEGRSALCPACGAGFVASAAKASSSQPAAVPASSAVAAPPPTAAGSAKPAEALRCRRYPVEALLSDSWDVLVRRRRPLFWPFLVPAGVFALTVVWPAAYLNQRAATDWAFASRGMLVWLPWSVVWLSYTVWSALFLAAAVCEGRADRGDATVPQVEPESRFLPRWGVLARLCLLTAVVVALAGLLAALVVAAGRWAGTIAALEFRLLVYGVTGVLALGSVLLAALRFWPLCWLAYHGTPVTRWLGRAWAISGASLMTSFFLMVVLGVLLGLGFSLFGLGLLLAMPLGGLIGEVAWRRISGRAIPVLDASSGPSESRRPS